MAKMQVLVAHNYYRSDAPSGENVVVDAEIAALRDLGVNVLTYLKTSDAISAVSGKLRAATAPVHSQRTQREIAELLTRGKVDIIHLHNPYPLIGPDIVTVAHRHGVPIVQTVHNHRHGCVNGLLFRNGATCDKCLEPKWFAKSAAVAGRCYRGSAAQSAVMVGAQVLNGATWRNLDGYIALTPYVRDFLVGLRFPADRIFVKPNGVRECEPSAAAATGSSFLYVGRLEDAKGADFLAELWEQHRPGRLTVVGDGPLRDRFASLARHDRDVEFLGKVHPTQVGRLMASAKLLLVPSRSREAFPRVIPEAFSAGLAVAVSDTPSLRGLVGGAGWEWPLKLDVWATELARISESQAQGRGLLAKARFHEEYSERATLDRLMDIYGTCIAARQPQGT